MKCCLRNPHGGKGTHLPPGDKLLFMYCLFHTRVLLVVLSVLLLVGAGVRLLVTGLLLVVTVLLLVVTGFGLVVTGLLLVVTGLLSVVSEFVWVATLGHGSPGIHSDCCIEKAGSTYSLDLEKPLTLSHYLVTCEDYQIMVPANISWELILKVHTPCEKPH